MLLSFSISLVALAALILILRSGRPSLGLPIAYLLSLLIIHLPGGYVHIVSSGVLEDDEYVARGLYFTAIASICFVIGVWWSHFNRKTASQPTAALNPRFLAFCVIAGWAFIAAFFVLRNIPSVAALIDKGSSIWILGALLGLREALEQGQVRRQLKWICIAGAFPIMTLIGTGYLSRATSAMFMATCGAMVVSKSYLRVLLVLVFGGLIFINLFVNYFLMRSDLRAEIDAGASIQERVDSVVDALSHFKFFDPDDARQRDAVDQRLNQNYFEGLAAVRIESGSVDYLYGRSVWQAVLSLVPRIIWPEKPVFGGSPDIVAEMTGLRLSTTTAWGVGHVMEMQINFGIPGLVGGFFIIGWLLGVLDKRSALASDRDDYATLILYFLPATGLIFPEGSLVEMAGGAAAALAAAVVWSWVWSHFVSTKYNGSLEKVKYRRVRVVPHRAAKRNR